MFSEHEAQTHLFIRAQDFHIGRVINIFGRDFEVYDCDDFTENYLKAELGRSAAEVKPVLDHGDGVVH